MIRIVFILLCFIFHSAYADEHEENSYLIDLQGMPSSMVAGCVNAITGNYSESHLDLQVTGTNPIPVICSYNSSKQDKGTLCSGWDINLGGEATVGLGDSKKKAVVNHGGSSYNFKGTASGEEAVLEDNIYKYGVTNASRRRLTAREKLSNTKFHSRKYKKESRLVLNDNEELEYKLTKKTDESYFKYQLDKHFFPNRCKHEYQYSGNKISQVKSLGNSGKLLGYVNYLYPKKFENEPRLTLVTCDGRPVEYNFTKVSKDRYFLDNVNSPHLPRRSYKYYMPDKSQTVRLYWSEAPDSRFTNIIYYEKGLYNVWGNVFKINGSRDPRSGRVSVLRQPTGTDTSHINTFSFIYHLDKDHVSSKPIGGYTEVYDAYANKTIYTFSKEHRLEGVQNFRSNGELYRHEKIEWGSGNDYTLLKRRELCDGQGKVWFKRSYHYDKHGNSIEEKVSGDLTGNNGFDTFPKAFTYTKHHQVASEKDGRKEIQYFYHPNSDLLSAKYILEYSQIKQRVFFDYDENGALISEIIDDGNQKGIDSLTGVTQRLIKRIHPMQSIPVGLPEVIDELCLDINTQQEVFLKRTTNNYSREGYLIEQKVYDCNKNFAYSKTWTYNAMGKVLTEKDPQGIVTHYEYDANGNCTLRKIDNTNYYTCYTYDYSNRLIREENVYCDGLRLAKTYSYDFRGNKTCESDIYGNATHYHYDEFNRLVEINRPPIVTADGSTQRPQENISYDVLNNVTAKTDGNGNTTYFSCTALGKPYRIQYPEGTCEKSIYHVDGMLHKLFLPNGSYIQYQYDYQKRVTSEETFAPDGTFLCKETRQYNAFNLISHTDKNGNVTTFSYDGSGKLISAKTNSSETRFFYDTIGRQTEIWELISEGNYKKTVKIYDWLDRVVEERIQDHDSILSRKEYSYDSQGNKTREIIHTSQGENCKTTEYNDQNQPIKITHRNGETTYFVYNYNYHDAWGHCVAYYDSIDPKGNRTSYIYNTHGKLAGEEYYSPTGTLIKKLSYRYDLAGNLVQRLEDIIIDNAVTDTVITALEYDSRNREIGIIKAYGRPEQKIFRKTYTHFDNIASQNKPDGVVINYSYDMLGRLIEVSDTANTVYYNYTYDLNDNVLSVTDKITQTTTTRVFDNNDLLVSETLDNGLQLNFQNDRIGRVVGLTLPDGSNISYTYDALNLKSISRGNYTQTYAYDLSGRPSQITLPQNNGTITYQYDSALRLVSVDSDFFTQAVPENGYDPNNNILTLNQTDSLGAVTSNYGYDALNQVVSEDGIATHIYAYDSRQNRSQKDSTPYENDILSQLISQGSTNYSYDSNGNRQSGKNIDCEYDAMDRLIKVTNGETQVSYKYDAFNRRVSKTVSSGGSTNTVRYLYSGDTEIGAVEADGSVAELMIAAGAQPAMLEIRGNMYLPIHDHRQNVVTIIDADTHKVIETYRYSAFGEEELFDASGTPLSSPISSWRFSGKRVDPETGWVYFGRRYYDPEVGRWTTPDPLWFEDGPNLYAYVQNNPIIFVDPNGLKHHKASQNPHAKTHWKWNHYEKVVGAFRWCFSSLWVFGETKNDRSRIYDVGENKNTKVGLCFINGVFNSFNSASASAEMLSEMIGGAFVKGVYNSSYGMFDLIECLLGFMRIDTDPVEMLHQLWNEEFAKLSPDGIIAQVCHSQGAIHVRNALERYDPEKRKRIYVLAVCPGAYISDEICGRALHLVSDCDPVPLIDPYRRKLNPDAIKVLKSHPEAFYFDHFFDSATFQPEILEWVKTIFAQQGMSIYEK